MISILYFLKKETFKLNESKMIGQYKLRCRRDIGSGKDDDTEQAEGLHHEDDNNNWM